MRITYVKNFFPGTGAEADHLERGPVLARIGHRSTMPRMCVSCGETIAVDEEYYIETAHSIDRLHLACAEAVPDNRKENDGTCS